LTFIVDMRKIPFSLLQEWKMNRVPNCVDWKIGHRVDVQVSLVRSHLFDRFIPSLEGSKNNRSCHIISNCFQAVFLHQLLTFLLNLLSMSPRWFFPEYLLGFEDQILSISPKFHVLIFLSCIFPHSIDLFMSFPFEFPSWKVRYHLSPIF
jgi:hypothetical protein